MYTPPPSPKDLPSFERPREKLFTRGTQALSDVEIVQLLLGVGTKKAPLSVLAEQVLSALREQLLADDLLLRLGKIHGITAALIGRVVAAVELTHRLQTGHKPLREVTDFLTLVQEYRAQRQEHIILICMDAGMRFLSKHVIGIGTLSQVLIHPREVFATALQARSGSIVLVHNHPSGQLEPSADDISVTNALREAGKLLGLPLYDHIILSKKGEYSFRRQSGLWG